MKELQYPEKVHKPLLFGFFCRSKTYRNQVPSKLVPAEILNLEVFYVRKNGGRRRKVGCISSLLRLDTYFVGREFDMLGGAEVL